MHIGPSFSPWSYMRTLFDFLEPRNTPLSEYGEEDGEYMTIEDFITTVENGGFIDYDGVGSYATKDYVTDYIVYPSDVENGTLPDSTGYTHIMWFNK